MKINVEGAKKKINDYFNNTSQEQILKDLEEAGLVLRNDNEFVDVYDDNFDETNLKVIYDTIDNNFSLSISNAFVCAGVDLSKEQLRNLGETFIKISEQK
ncbi:hypothetical protein D3C81_728920 [compost metagenome]